MATNCFHLDGQAEIQANVTVKSDHKKMFFGFTFDAETIEFTNCDNSRALQSSSLGIISVRTGATLDLAANILV